jgi:hypothetical protein
MLGDLLEEMGVADRLYSLDLSHLGTAHAPGLVDGISNAPSARRRWQRLKAWLRARLYVRLVRNWGRIGTNGQARVEAFASEIEARQALKAVAPAKHR